jgi:hypothetical protein
MSAFCSAVHASPQRPYGFKISLYNTCLSPIKITASHYRPKGWEGLGIEELLNSSESVLIFLGVHGSSDIEYILPDDYRLEISANGKTLILDKTRFLEVLKKSDYSEEKCGFFCRTGTFSGTIKDPSLCP